MKTTLIATFIATLCSVGSTAPLSDSEYQNRFTNYINTYDKEYDADELHFRYNIFRDNTDKIRTHNEKYYNGDTTWKMAENEFVDMLWHEFRDQYTGLSSTPPQLQRFQSREMFTTNKLPSSFDWTEKGAVTTVKNQKQCGSCWAFSTTGSTEGAHFLKTGKLVSLSEQQLVDCSSKQGNQGCSGGLMDQGFEYIEKYGLCAEESYPYTAVDGECKNCTSVVSIISFVDVPKNNEEALQKALSKTPISIALEADQSGWQFYSSGVMTGDCGTALDHGVLLVGWGTLNGIDYWKVKNSWGTTWGEEGYILLQRNKGPVEGQCGLAMQPSYPVV